RDLVVVDLATHDPTVAVEVPHLAHRQRPRLAGGRKGTERAVVRAPRGEPRHDRFAGLVIAGLRDLTVRGRLDPSGQELAFELVRCGESGPLRLVDPGDALGVFLDHRLEIAPVEGFVPRAVGLDVACCVHEAMVAARRFANLSPTFLSW